MYLIRSKIYLHRLNPDKQRAQELDGQHSNDGCMIYCLFIWRRGMGSWSTEQDFDLACEIEWLKMTDQRSSSSCQPRNKTFSRVVLPISPHEWMFRISGYRYSSLLDYLIRAMFHKPIPESYWPRCVCSGERLKILLQVRQKNVCSIQSVFSSFNLSLGIRHSIQSIAAVTTTTCWLQFQIKTCSSD
jgi:hypothetical protein